MNISEQGIDILILREGQRRKAYLDTKGIPTIGVGHTGPEVKLGLVWTDDEIRQVFKQDLSIVEQCLDKNVLTPLTQHQYDALMSFVFNVGVNAFKRSTMLKYINLRNFAAASREFDRWHIPPEITSRRNSEREQFISP